MLFRPALLRTSPRILTHFPRAMSLSTVSTTAAPSAIGPYSQAISAPPFLFLSGCIPLDPSTGEIIQGGVEEQTRQALKNLKEVVIAGGSELAKVVKTTVFLQNMDDFQKVNAVYANTFGDHKPARSAVEVARYAWYSFAIFTINGIRLPKDVLVEIEAIALVGNKV